MKIKTLTLAIITISIFSLPAYALRDPQIPDGSSFSYVETINIGEGKNIKVIDKKTGDRNTFCFPCIILIHTGEYRIL